MGANRGMGSAMLTHDELVFNLGSFTFLPILVKIDKKCDRESAHRRKPDL